MSVIGKPRSRFWLGPDRESGLHYLEYKRTEFDALPHLHAEYNFTLCMEESFRITRCNMCEVLTPGDIVIINPGDRHFSDYGVEQAPTKGLTLFVPKREMVRLLSRIYPSVYWEGFDVRFTRKVHFPGGLDIARSLVYELERRPAGYELMLETATTHFLISLLRECLEPHLAAPVALPPQLPSWQMVRAIEHMNAQGKTQLRVPELSREIGSSPSRFIRLFTNSAGISPAGYFNRLLLHKASVMLRHQCSTKEVAFALGFSNDSHFCTFFRRLSGLTPGEFKNRKK